MLTADEYGRIRRAHREAAPASAGSRLSTGGGVTFVDR